MARIAGSAVAGRRSVRGPRPPSNNQRIVNANRNCDHGIHKCVGAPLARLELTVVLQELLGRTSAFEFAGEPRRGSVVPSAFKTIPIRVTRR